MSSIITSKDQRPDTYRILLGAIDWAARAGIPIDLAEGPRIACCSVYGRERWIRTNSELGVSPLEAVVLYIQPLCTELMGAMAEAMECSQAEVEGIWDGLEKRTPSQVWTKSHMAWAFIHGYEVGTRLRMTVLTAVCPRHNHRHARLGICPKCEAEGLVLS